MTIPPPSSLNSLSPHRPKPRHRILHNRAQKRPMMRHSCNKWRTIIKHIRIILTPLLHRLLKRPIFLPPFNQSFFIFRRFSSTPCLIFHDSPLFNKNPAVSTTLRSSYHHHTKPLEPSGRYHLTSLLHYNCPTFYPFV